MEPNVKINVLLLKPAIWYFAHSKIHMAETVHIPEMIKEYIVVL